MGIMKKKKKEPMGELRMDSTADVAFLLLIFFIVTTIFAAEQGLTLVLPGKQKEKTDTVKVKESNIATLFVEDDNSVTLDRKPIEINHIKHAIEDRILGQPQARGAAQDPPRRGLRHDGRLPRRAAAGQRHQGFAQDGGNSRKEAGHMDFGRSTNKGTFIPTSSMGDIAFLLLIFFMVTTIFREESGPAGRAAPRRSG